MPDMPDVVKILVFSIVAYVYLFLIAKLLGKKQIAQLSFIDYVVGITIGSIAGEMATETQEPIYYYIIAMGIFFLFNLTVSLIGRKSPTLKKLVMGKPSVLIEDGKINYKNLKKSKLTVNEVAAAARDKGFFDLNDIAYALFETSGKLSILPRSNKSPVINENMNITLPPPTLPQYVVVDGKLSRDTLADSGLSEAWVRERLRISNDEDMDNILVAAYDSVNDRFNVQYKSPKPSDQPQSHQ